MSINLYINRLWQQRGNSDVHIKLLWFLHLTMTFITWFQLSVGGVRSNNNFTIFKNSFFHLIHHQSLYSAFPDEYYDLFQYHPVFAVLFAPIALLPAPIDLFIWLFCSTIAFLFALKHLGLDKRWTVWLMLLSVFEVSKNVLYSQTNILITTGMMVAFIFFERQKQTQAVFTSVLNFCFKGFGAITGLLAVLYPKSVRSIVQGIAFTLLMSLTPLFFITPTELQNHYAEWLNLLRGDVISEPYSLVGFLTRTVHLPTSIEPFVLLFGVVILTVYWLLLWLKRNELTTERRAYFLAFMLLWVVVFNRAAESATYIVAATGLIIWYFFHKQNGTSTQTMTIFFAVCFYFVAINCSDLALPFLKAWDKKYFFRPVFALMPMLWILADECMNFNYKNIEKIKLNY